MDNNKIEIFTDGACRGNPGPGGWGALLRFGSKEKEINGYAPSTTNNIMELTAVIEALKQIKKPYEIDITTDSIYVKNGITVWIHNWKTNGWKTAAKKSVKNKELWVELDELIQIHQINWIWVKGHSGHPENEKADELANIAIDNFV
jgi:ribonuclease HI|tara:strand:- start:985 stop:1425 length:441 start_codon:yes stop_codon:yes gene_type:complete